MKNFGFLYFVPPMAFLAILFLFARGGWQEMFSPVILFNLIFMLAAGVLMYKGKIMGAYLGVAFGAVWIIRDFFAHPHIPSAVLCVPLIIYYIYCAIALKNKPDVNNI